MSGRSPEASSKVPSTSDLQPWLKPYADYLLNVSEYNFGRGSLNSVYRSNAAQQNLYDRYLRGLSQYPVAPPGTSLHEHRLAFDYNVPQGGRSPQQTALGRFWASMGGGWSPKDPIHFYVRL